jgi:beta-glucosidase-like glycosyl hydrolase
MTGPDILRVQRATAAGTPGRVAEMEITAGHDMLLMGPDLPNAYRTVLSRIRSSTFFRAAVRNVAHRVLDAKERVVATPKPNTNC